MILLEILLVLTASLSPLLTFAALWQVKEWRIDRLRVHLKSEGFFRQLFGVTRPAITLLWLLAFFILGIPPETWIIGGLIGLTALSILQLALDRQPSPLWTKKAVAVVAGAAALTVLAAFIVGMTMTEGRLSLVFFPLLQPLPLFLSLTAFYPLDRFLKRRIMNRARALRESRIGLIVIGITGSVGKTTTKELLLHILEEGGARATPAYVNTEMGVSEWMIKELSAPVPPEVLIVEMGAYRKGEISLLCEIAKPTIGIVTFIGTQHIGLFGSQEALLEAKAELFDALPEDGFAILNLDSPLSDSLKTHVRCPSTTVSTGGPAGLSAFDIEEIPSGIRFRAGNVVFVAPLHGTHNVVNVLLAIAAAEFLGLKKNEIAKKLTTFRPPEHTFSVKTMGSCVVLDDTHNSSQASFKAAISWARTQPAEEKVLLSSGLIELGEAEDRTHSELGIEAVGTFDRVIFLNARHGSAFERGYGRNVEILRKDTPRVSPGSLLVCVGRISEDTIRRLLP